MQRSHRILFRPHTSLRFQGITGAEQYYLSTVITRELLIASLRNCTDACEWLVVFRYREFDIVRILRVDFGDLFTGTMPENVKRVCGLTVHVHSI